MSMMAKVGAATETEEDSREALRVFDKDGNGCIPPVRVSPVDNLEKLIDEEVGERLRHDGTEKEFDVNLSDEDGDGTITTKELETVMRSLSPNPTTAEPQDISREVDSGGNPTVDFPELMSMMPRKVKGRVPEVAIREAFHVFDKAGNGCTPAVRVSPAGNQKKLIDEEVVEIVRHAGTEEDFDDNLYDKDGVGTITTMELGTLMRSLSQTPTTAEPQDISKEVDSDCNPTFDFPEPVTMMMRKGKGAETEEDSREVFRVFDKDGNGCISTAKIFHVDTKDNLFEDEVVEMLRHAGTQENFDVNRDDSCASVGQFAAGINSTMRTLSIYDDAFLFHPLPIPLVTEDNNTMNNVINFAESSLMDSSQIHPATGNNNTMNNVSNFAESSLLDSSQIHPAAGNNNTMNNISNFESSCVPDTAKFVQYLYSLLHGAGYKGKLIPVIQKQPMDMYALFHVVESLGGYKQVLDGKLWKQVAIHLSLKPDFNAYRALKKWYNTLLLPHTNALNQYLGDQAHEIVRQDYIEVQRNTIPKKHTETEAEKATRLARRREAYHLKKQKQVTARSIAIHPQTVLNEESTLQSNPNIQQTSSISTVGRESSPNSSYTELLVRKFKSSIQVYANDSCEVCRKLFFPRQLQRFDVNSCCIAMRTCIPEAIFRSPVIQVCRRCKGLLQKKTNKIPSSAWWNSLEPGEIPESLKQLSEVEIRLLSRVIHFMKIIKYEGRFGQFGFKGQVLLFAQDLNEVAPAVANILPRPLSQLQLIMVAESLETRNINRSFTISKSRVLSALQFLRTNNPLYKDVQVVDMDNADVSSLIRTMPSAQTSPPDTEGSEEIGEASTPLEQIQQSLECCYITLRDGNGVLPATYHQGELPNGGSQCMAMVATALMKATISDPINWTTSTMDYILFVGNDYYQNCVQLASNLPQNGYLLSNDLVPETVQFGYKFQIDVEHDASVYGTLMGTEDGVFNLQHGVFVFFEARNLGILTVNDYTYGLILKNGKYFLFDSHAVKIQEKRSKSGKACIFQFKTLTALTQKLAAHVKGLPGDQFTLQNVNIIHEEMIQQQVITSNIEGSNHICSVSLLMRTDPTQPQEETIIDVGESDVNQSQPIPILRITRKDQGSIVNANHEKKAEELTWFHLFPYGINGLQEDRKVPITPLDYYQVRIMGTDKRFQNIEYLFYALSMTEWYRIKQSISVCAKSLTTGNSTGMVEDIHLCMRNIRGSSAYWNSCKSELISMIKGLGPPTFFITLSCNDLHWPDMLQALLLADGDSLREPKDLSDDERIHLVQKYPIVVSRQFMMRFQMLLTTLKNTPQILGEIKDSWWRVEFQNRGSPHIHMLLWIQDAPDLKTDEGIAFIDKYITCEIPTSHSLKGIVTRCQMHRHTHTCRKGTGKGCRFKFPRIVSTVTRMVDLQSEEFINNGGRNCVLRRKVGEETVNNYNAMLLLLWEGNIDVQPCGNSESIAYYIAKYCAKSEPTGLEQSLQDAIAAIRGQEIDASKRMFRICMALLNKRQVSACEAAFRLCHLVMKQSSRKVIFLNTRPKQSRYRVINVQTKDFYQNIFDRYENRPETLEFEGMNLATFASNFEAYYPKSEFPSEEDGDEDAFDEEPETEQRIIKLKRGGYMKRRNKPLILRTPTFSVTKDRELYFYSLAVLYIPFRNETLLLDGNTDSENVLKAHQHILSEAFFPFWTLP